MMQENSNEGMTYGSVKNYYDAALSALVRGQAETASAKLTHAILELDALCIEEKNPAEARRLKELSDNIERFQRSIEQNFQNKPELQKIIDETFKDVPKLPS